MIKYLTITNLMCSTGDSLSYERAVDWPANRDSNAWLRTRIEYSIYAQQIDFEIDRCTKKQRTLQICTDGKYVYVAGFCAARVLFRVL